MQPSQIEKLFDEAPAHYEEEHQWLFRDFKTALNRGEIRAAEPDASAKSGWRANAWVKKGILLGFRMGAIADMSIDAAKQPFFDKSTYPARAFAASDGVRIVPGGSSIRDGSYIGRGVICIRWRRHDDRFARARWKLRAGRTQLPHFRGVANRRRS